MKINQYINCPICGFDGCLLIFPATNDEPRFSSQIQVTEKYFGLHGDIVKCKSCGFAYVGKDQYIKKIQSLYKDMRDEVYLQEENERRYSFLEILKITEKIRNDKKGKVLDIGCCTGGLLAEARIRGWDVFGLDPSLWACQTAKRFHSLDIHNGTTDNFKNKSVRFDAITLLDVLEHVDNPKKLMLQINSLLKNDGVFCIVTPDFGSITARLLGLKWWGIRLAHLSYFRKQDLVRLIQDTGFRIIKQKTYIRYFSLYYILVRLVPIIEKYKIIKSILKNISVPLVFFDTFELYLEKAPVR
jgi:2-polyprenyl-3-methyl-5-hydroxy-6-metoxy-1,4-benzoquinol methylase